MGRSQRLTLGQVAAVFRLAREACELGDDPVAWRRHALERFSHLIGSSYGACMVLPLPFDASSVRFLRIVEHGDGEGPGRWHEMYSRGHALADPTTPSLSAPGRRFMRIQPQESDHRACYRPACVNEFRRPPRQDDQLFSHMPLAALRCSSALGFTRGLGDGPFHGRHARMVDLFHRELGRLWATPPLVCRGRDLPRGCRAGLPPRLDQTLRMICAGDGEKQIAAKLGLSRHTVHDYVKALHDRFGAHSVGELIDRARPARYFRPDLGWEPDPAAARA